MSVFLLDMTNLRRSTYALAVACALGTFSLQPCQAQTFTMLHSFTGQGDGGQPTAGLIMDQRGDLYGTASQGGYTRHSFLLVDARPVSESAVERAEANDRTVSATDWANDRGFRVRMDTRSSAPRGEP